MTDPIDRSPLDGQHEIAIRDFRPETDRLEASLRTREIVRSRLAAWVFALITIVTLLLVGGVIADRLSVDEAKDLGAAVLAPITAIFAGVVGFFFGAERRSR
ncbi:MAG: hypothetical protein WDN24_22005 [Sphingomonas sp.]